MGFISLKEIKEYIIMIYTSTKITIVKTTSPMWVSLPMEKMSMSLFHSTLAAHLLQLFSKYIRSLQCKCREQNACLPLHKIEFLYIIQYPRNCTLRRHESKNQH